jgi:hypothetical protein
MSQQILQTSAHFRANLGVLNEAAAQEFSKWAAVNCIHHILRKEDGSTVLYATRQNSRTEQQHKNALRALASNRKIKLKTEASFLRLLHEEYEVTGGEASATDVQMDEPSLEKATLRMPCRVELFTELPAGFDELSEQMRLRLALVAASA